MQNNRKLIMSYKNTALLLSMIFFVCMVAEPTVHPPFKSYSSITNRPYTGNLPIQKVQIKQEHLISESIGNEMLNDIENSLLMNRYIQNYQKVIQRIVNNLLPFAGFSVMVYCFGYFNRKKTKHKSVMAFSIGGHAPPYRPALNEMI